MNGPNSPTSREHLARLLQEVEQLRAAGQSERAEQICRALVLSHPGEPALLNTMGLLAMRRGATIEAEDYFGRAIHAAPNIPQLHLNLANLLYGADRLADAERAYRKAIELKPDSAEAHYSLGVVLRQAGATDNALAALRRAVALRPNYAEAQVQIGALLHEKGENEGALAALDSALRANGSSFDAHYYRGTVLRALGRPQESLTALKTAVSLQPSRHEAWHALGNSLLASGQEDEALETYGRTVELAPDFLPAHLELNALAWVKGRNDLHLKSFGIARERGVETPDLLLAEADERLRLRQNEQAERLLRRAIEHAPERADLRNGLARALAAQKRYAEGIEVLKAAVDLEPWSVDHRRDLAIVLLQDHQPKAARDVLESALLDAPADQLLLAHLAVAQRELGDSKLAWLVDLDRCVRVFDLPPPRGFQDMDAFNAALAPELLSLHTAKMEPLRQSLRGGTQTMGRLFGSGLRHVELLRERIAEAIAEYIKDLDPEPGHPFLARKANEISFNGSWSCRLQSGGFHQNHVHANGWISSAYYVSLPEAVHDEDARQGWLKFGESNLALGDSDRAERMIRPVVGRLVLFPSYFWHGTVPFSSEQTRLTIAFDAVPGAVR